MPTAAQAAHAQVLAHPLSPPASPAAGEKKGLLSLIPQGPDKKCHPLLGSITRLIRISIKLKHMAGYRTQSPVEQHNLFA